MVGRETSSHLMSNGGSLKSWKVNLLATFSSSCDFGFEFNVTVSSVQRAIHAHYVELNSEEGPYRGVLRSVTLERSQNTKV